MVKFTNDEEKFNSEAKVDLELEDLEKEFSHFPLGVFSSETSDIEKDSSLESIKGDKRATNAPFFLKSSFPLAPNLCSGMSEGHVRLLHTNNVKI